GRGPVPEEGSVLLRRGAQMPVEGGSDAGGGAEPRAAADVFDGLVGRFQQFTGAVEACAGEPGHRRCSGLLAEPADEGPGGHAGAFGGGAGGHMGRCVGSVWMRGGWGGFSATKPGGGGSSPPLDSGTSRSMYCAWPP